MKILLTTHQFLPEYFSGTKILAFQVAKELQIRGHEVSVSTGTPATGGSESEILKRRDN